MWDGTRRSSLKNKRIKSVKLHPSVENHERTLLIVSRLVVTYMDVESDRKAYDLYSCIGHSVAMLKANFIADIAGKRDWIAMLFHYGARCTCARYRLGCGRALVWVQWFALLIQSWISKRDSWRCTCDRCHPNCGKRRSDCLCCCCRCHGTRVWLGIDTIRFVAHGHRMCTRFD